jgi:hypothetical protein
MSAASTVFSIAELLQQILSELPPLDIIRCQRVDSTWKKLIVGSPLLQYKAWLHNDFPDPAHYIRADDLLPEYRDLDGDKEEDYKTKCDKEGSYERKRYNYNVSKHLNPIVVAMIMQHPPDSPSNSFDPLKKMDEDGFGGYFSFRPILLRDLMQWYERNKTTEHIWGQMSLYRPDARRIDWSLPLTSCAGLRLEIEAVRTEDPNAEVYSTDFGGIEVRVNKKPGEPLVLKLSDLMGLLDVTWKRWIESEHEEHYLSHDGAGCDFDMGIPGHECLESDEEEDGEDGEEGEEEEKGETFGCKMSMESHIDWAVISASR